MTKVKQPLDLTTCPITSGLIRFSLPFLASSILQTMYSTVDTIIVGQFCGSAGLAAVNNVSYICNAAGNIGLGASAGSAVLIAQYCGAKNEEGVHRTVGTALSISAIMAVILSVIVCCFVGPILNLVNIPLEARGEARNYLMIRAACFLISFFYNSITSFLRGMGDSKRPLYFSAVASIANVFLDLLFVAALHMGAGGAAIATEIAELISLVWAFLYLRTHQPGMLTLDPHQYQIHGPTAKTVLKIGIPSSFQYLFIDLSFVFVNSIINGYGESAMAGFTAGFKILIFCTTCICTLGTGLTNYASQNLGAGEIKRIKTGFLSELVISSAVSMVLFALVFLFSGTLVGLFLEDGGSAALDYGKLFVKIVSPFFIVVNLKVAADCTVRGCGGNLGFMVSTFADLILRVAFAFILSPVLGMQGVFWSWPIGWGIGTVIALLFYFNIPILKKFRKQSSAA